MPYGWTGERVSDGALQIPGRDENYLQPILLPGVEYSDAEAIQVLHVPSDDGEIVFQGGRRGKAIGSIKRRSLQLAFAIEHSPALSNRLVNREDASPTGAT